MVSDFGATHPYPFQMLVPPPPPPPFLFENPGSAPVIHHACSYKVVTLEIIHQVSSDLGFWFVWQSLLWKCENIDEYKHVNVHTLHKATSAANMTSNISKHLIQVTGNQYTLLCPLQNDVYVWAYLSGFCFWQKNVITDLQSITAWLFLWVESQNFTSSKFFPSMIIHWASKETYD